MGTASFPLGNMSHRPGSDSILEGTTKDMVGGGPSSETSYHGKGIPER